MAWYGFLRELQQDPEKYQSDRVQLLLGSMEALRTQIFKLDHQKSDLEAGKKNDIDNRSIHQNLQRLSENYDKVIDEMKALYQKINQEYQDQG
ncbi:hypothetical protein Echvi_4545 [Echinicola vietnamensis DSM 17526]|uniref:Uncharacterized protein n=2 Tax=Echinicola TaxID=390846 RepID=L0G5Z4_ECHVK|nr:hypothetical protein Echvi_4545 [Echinicola vietnamensis DSM 17526]